MARRAAIEQVYQFDVRLIRIDPPIWRRIQVSNRITLSGLHHLLQVVMGWEHSHLHQFLIGSQRYGDLDPEDEEMSSDLRVRLRDLPLKPGDTFTYEYDFGDDWHHLLTLEDTWPRNEMDIAPRCLDGARACPPEDCGGVGGYERLLEVLRDKRHSEHRELRAWAGKHFDPACFSAQAVNSALALLVALGVTS